MTIVSTSEDLLNLLREDAHFYEQVRRLILTDELINLPARFTAFTERVDGFIANQEQFNANQEQFNDRVDARFDRVDARFDRVDARFDRMEADLSYFKNRFSESQVVKEAAAIAMAMGCTLERVVGNSELAQMCRHTDAGALRRGDLVSFTLADLVLKVSDEQDGRQFIAVEISYTADRRDTDRARRNADYITRFTGQPALAVVASVRNDQATQSLIDEGIVSWYQLEDTT